MQRFTVAGEDFGLTVSLKTAQVMGQDVDVPGPFHHRPPVRTRSRPRVSLRAWAQQSRAASPLRPISTDALEKRLPHCPGYRKSLDKQHALRAHNTIQYNTMQCNEMQCNATQRNAMQCNAMQYNTIQGKARQGKAIQYNTIQYNCINHFGNYSVCLRCSYKTWLYTERHI